MTPARPSPPGGPFGEPDDPEIILAGIEAVLAELNLARLAVERGLPAPDLAPVARRIDALCQAAAAAGFDRPRIAQRLAVLLGALDPLAESLRRARAADGAGRDASSARRAAAAYAANAKLDDPA